MVTGFEPLDILEGIRRTVHQLEEGRHEVENAYPRAGPGGRQPGSDRDARGRVRGDRSRLARHRDDPAERMAALGEVPRVRRGAPVLRHRHPHAGVERLPQRRGAPGVDQAARVRSLRHAVHAAQPVGRHHGLQRGSLRGLLPLPAPVRADEAGPAGGELRWFSRSSSPPGQQRRRARGVDLPVAAARQPDSGDGPRRWRGDVGRARRPRLPAELQRPAARHPHRLGSARRRGWADRVLDGLVRGPAALLPGWRHRTSRSTAP